MKTRKDLWKYYVTALLPALNGIEQKRKRLLRLHKTLVRVYWGVMIGLIGVFIGSLSLPGQVPERFEPVLKYLAATSFGLFFLLLIPGLPLFMVIWAQTLRSLLRTYYIVAFNETIFPKIVAWVHPNLTYHPNRQFPCAVFLASQLFPLEYPLYRSEYYCSGTIGETAIEFATVHLAIPDMKSPETCFHGIFFAADCNKPFTGVTLVLPDTIEKTFGRFAAVLQKQAARSRALQLIKLEDPEFEKEFVVYGDDQVRARYLLTPGMMKRIVAFHHKAHRPIHLSFAGSKIFVAIAYDRSLFQPRFRDTMLDFHPVQEYVEDIQLALSLVEDLNLNTRIWDAPVVSSAENTLIQIIKTYQALIGDQKAIFFHPLIPAKGLQKALKKYAPPCAADETPLALIDENVFGKEKSGCLITDWGIYSKLHLERRKQFALSEVTEVQHHWYVLRNSLTVNGACIFESFVPRTVKLEHLQLIAEMIQVMANHRQHPKGQKDGKHP